MSQEDHASTTTVDTAENKPVVADRRGLKKGDPWVWLGAGATAIVLLLFLTLVGVVLVNGFGTFWVKDMEQLTFADGQRVIGAITDEDDQGRLQIYTGNRDLYSMDYRWVETDNLTQRNFPKELVLFERVERGNYVGFLEAIQLGDETLRVPRAGLWESFNEELATIQEDMSGLDVLRNKLGEANKKMEKLQFRLMEARKFEPEKVPGLEASERAHQEAFEDLSGKLDQMRQNLRTRVAVMRDARGSESRIALADIVRAYRPNDMGFFDKLGTYASKVRELLLDRPRESNTEGGLLPAILGTVLMVMIMSVFCVPLGVVAAVYLREYAREGVMVNLVRIAVNNLAGVPSIVYGMFGLGFFVYGIGGSIDALFFAERLPNSTFGTGGLLWASLTMALLTVPVVIVSTEEGLNSVPQGVRDGSLALGATKFQTLTGVVLPMATPGILTGLILAIARAAGEVAPLMLVGVVKIVPSLPVDSEFPYIQLERKFMHLGFHIYDVGFQSPNVEAAMPMVYVTTLLLLLLVLTMSFLAMYLRNRMKKRYSMGAF